MSKLEGEGGFEVIKGCRNIKYTPNDFVCVGGEGRYAKIWHQLTSPPTPLDTC